MLIHQAAPQVPPAPVVRDLAHQPDASADVNRCANLTGPITSIATGLDDRVKVIISAPRTAVICTIDDSSSRRGLVRPGGPAVTSASIPGT